MSGEKFICDKCKKHTELIQKIDNIGEGIARHFAECKHCGYQSTIFYQNAEIKALMYQQRKTKFGTKKKQKLCVEIKNKMDALKERVESQN